jgi:hypothetical protein
VILRRLYLYLVSAAALTVLAFGIVFLGGTILLFVVNDPSANDSRGQLAIFTAMTVVALPVWAAHFFFAQRFASRDPYERSSALRRLYLYWACLAGSLATMGAVSAATVQLLLPYLDSQPANWLSASQIGWAAVVFAVVWATHFYIAMRDRAAVGEEGASATLRRWYIYIALLAGLLLMLGGAASLLQVVWTKAAVGTHDRFYSLAGPAGMAIGGTLVWAVHARVIATQHVADDRHSTLRAVEGFIAVAISIAVALTGAAQILYYVVARALGVSDPGNAGSNFIAAAAAPTSQLLVYGIAWFLINRRLQRDAATQEADRQAAIRRLYTNLATLISLAAWGYGSALMLSTLAEQAEAPLIGVKAGDWRDPISLAFTLTIVGGAVWAAHWRHSPWAADRQSLSRKLYVWAALLGSVLAVLGGGVGIVNAVLQQAFSANPRLDDPKNLDFGQFLGIIAVSVAVAVYHWRVLRADAAARPHKQAEAPAVKAAVVSFPPVTATTGPKSEVLIPPGHRYTLVVTDATEDDIHQALSNLPPQASYHLATAEQTVDGH